MQMFFFFFVLSITGIHGTVTNLDCGGINDTATNNGTEVFFTCTVQTAAIRWSGTDLSIGFLSGTNNQGDNETNGGFIGTYTQVGPPAMSTLNFTLTVSLNNTEIICDDGGLPGPESCFILVKIPPSSPLNLTLASSTYESVLLQWSPPSFNGGSEITGYNINVSPSPSGSRTSCPKGQCNTDTTSLSFNVTDLDPREEYQFNVSAVNSAGEGESASINVPPLGTVFPALTDPPQLCLNFDNEELILSITWDCSSINNATTPPLINYTVCINNNCSMVSPGSCSRTLPVNCNDAYNVNVLINNIIGSSDPSPTANISTDILQSSMVDMITNESVRINYTPFNTCSDFTPSSISIILTNLNTSSMDTRSVAYNTNGMITLDSLNANTMYNYSLLLVANGNDDVCDVSQFINFMTKAVGDGGDNTPSFTPTPSVTPSVIATNTPPPSQSPTPTTPITSGSLPLGAIIGIAVGVILIVLGAVIIIIVVYCCLKNRDKSVNFNRGSRVDSAAEPIALVDKKDHGSSPATGQPIYQEAMSSEDIQREAAPTTGELYAQPNKGSVRRPPPQPQSELATYQDPSTIQRIQAPNMEYLYAEVDKSKPQQQQAVYAQVDKDKKGGDGTLYADLDLKTTQGGPVTGNNPPNVIYSDVHNN